MKKEITKVVWCCDNCQVDRQGGTPPLDTSWCDDDNYITVTVPVKAKGTGYVEKGRDYHFCHGPCLLSWTKSRIAG